MLSFLNLRALVRNYQSSARSATELCPWAVPFDERTVVTSDQGVLACFEYEGVDAEGRAQFEVDAAINSFERAFAGYRSGSFLWVTVDRRRTTSYPIGRHSEGIPWFVEQAWAQQVTASQFENRYSLSVFQRSSTGASGILDSMDRMVKEEGVSLYKAFLMAARRRLSLREAIRFNSRLVRSAVEHLDQRIAEMQAGLARLRVKRLAGDELMAFLFNRMNPVSGQRTSFPMPRLVSQFLNSYLTADSIERLPKCLRFSDGGRDRYVGVVSLKGWPDGATYGGHLDHLLSVNGEVSVVHCFHFVDREVAAKAIERVEKYNITASVPFLSRVLSTFMKTDPQNVDAGRLALAEEARAAKIDLVANNRAFGFHNLTVLCYGDTEAEMDAVRDQIMQRLADSFFVGRVETTHQLSAFCQTLPGQWQASVRWSHVAFANTADIVPIRTLRSGRADCPHLTRQLQHGEQPVLVALPTDVGVPFNWDFIETGAGHTAFIGPTRSGKTALVNMLQAIFGKYPNARVIRIDKDYSAKIPTVLAGGVHIDLTSERNSADGHRMCPIALVKESKHHNFLVGWVRRLIEAQLGRSLNPDEIDSLTSSVRNLAALPESEHTLSALRAGLGTLGRALDDWINDGSRAGWFDNEPRDIVFARDMCFEMKRLFSDELVAVMSMDYLFYLIECSLDGSPLIVSIEETWFFLRNPHFVARVEDFLRTIGKRNGSVWITTQTATELTANPDLMPLMEQIKNFVFLPNAGILSARDGYDKLGLTEEQLLRIQSAEPKRDYYIKTPSMVRMAMVRIPDEVLPIIESSSMALEVFERHRRSGLSDWPDRYHDEIMRSFA